MYDVTGAPFSFAGGVHFKCTLLLSQSLAYGFPGRSGSSIVQVEINIFKTTKKIEILTIWILSYNSEISF